MPYTPNATDTTEPVASREVVSAAQEFRTLKSSVNTRIASATAALALESSIREAVDNALAGEIQANSVKINALEQLALNGSTPGTVVKESFAAAGTTYTLSVTPVTVATVDVYINGVYQNQNSFIVVGNVVTLDDAPVTGAVVEIQASIPLAIGSTEASAVQYTPAGTGVVVSTVQAKLRESVSVKDFGAVGDGVTNDAPAIQLALNTGKSVFLPVGTYKLNAPITLGSIGQRLYGENSHSTYLTGGVTHDLVRVAASHCEVDHLHFRPGGYSDASPPAFAAIRIYAALAHVHDNRFLAAASNHGTAILLDDVNPVDSSIVAGAYIHTITENRIGTSGYDFKNAIYSYCVNNGQQATKFQNNQIWGDAAFYTYQGGGNYYVGNLLQSATGNYIAGVGNAIDLQNAVVGETITGNYIERYDYGIIIRRSASDYLVANVYGNHYDNNNTNFYSTGSGFYRLLNDELMTVTSNTWQENYNSQDNFKLKNREGTEVYNVNRASASFEPRVLAHNLLQSLSYSGNGTTQTPVSSFCEITGSGAARTGCFLGNGTRQGQHLYLRAHTWSVEILNNPGGTQNIYFAGNAASATFGQSGSVGTMHLIWDSTHAGGRWFEISRTLA